MNLTPRRDVESRPPETTRLEAGEVLFRQGDLGELVYVVDDGLIELMLTRIDGEETVVTRVEPRGYLGELAPMFGLQRSATARAVTKTTVTGYTARDFRIKHSASVGEMTPAVPTVEPHV